MSKNENFEKLKNYFFPIILKKIFSKNQLTGSKIVTCSLITDRQTDIHTYISELPPFSPLSRSGLKIIMSQGVLCQKIGSQVRNCDMQLAHRQTYIHQSDYRDNFGVASLQPIIKELSNNNNNKKQKKPCHVIYD